MSQQSIIDWNIDTERIKTLTKDLIKQARLQSDEIIKHDKSDENILNKLNNLELKLGFGMEFTNLVKSVYPDKNVRDACNESIAELSKFAIELKMDKELFNALQSIRTALDGKLDAESKRYLDRSIIERKLDGLHLDEETRKKVIELKEKISDLSIEYTKNCDEESTKLTFSLNDLNGVNENLINSLPKNEKGEYEVSLKYPVYFPVMKECKVPDTRRKLQVAFDKRCLEENPKILETVIELRHELAQLLGFKTYSEYSMVLLCAKTPQNVDNFLNKLADKMRILQEKEKEILLNYKKEECESLKIPFDGKLNPSDLKYYQNLREEKEFKVNQSKLQEYFPLSVVIDGTFKIYQLLLGLKFEECNETTKYVDDLRLFKVIDNATNETIGHFYTDLHPRDGKFGHAAIFGIKGASQRAKQSPVCMMVCNFTKPTADQPSLLTHDEVETFFHEFGHVMHHLCSKANYYKFGGTNVETDFVEAPSQMLENWCWKKESLKLLSSHYKDSSSIDEQILDSLIKSKNAANGFFNMRQILFARMDQHFHTNPKSDTGKIYRQLFKEHMLCDPEDPDVNMNGSFGHLVGGYEAQYYSYLWSEVYSQDMFESRFNKEGILNPKTGLDYRRCILEPGGSKDAYEMVTNFLGREPNEIAFLKSKGVDV